VCLPPRLSLALGVPPLGTSAPRHTHAHIEALWAPTTSWRRGRADHGASMCRAPEVALAVLLLGRGCGRCPALCWVGQLPPRPARQEPSIARKKTRYWVAVGCGYMHIHLLTSSVGDDRVQIGWR
jgi:hypothetical protein